MRDAISLVMLLGTYLSLGCMALLPGVMGGAIGWRVGRLIDKKRLGAVVGALFGVVIELLLVAEAGRAVLKVAEGQGGSMIWNTGGAQAVWTIGGQPWEVDVTVVDASGKPLPGVGVLADNSSGGGSGATDQNGHVIIRVGEGQLTGLYIWVKEVSNPIRVIHQVLPTHNGLQVTVTVTNPKASVPHRESSLPYAGLVALLGVGLILIVAGVSQQQRDRRKTEGRP